MAFKTNLLYFAQVKVVFKITFKNVFKVYVTLKWVIPRQVYAKTLWGRMPRGTNVCAWRAEQEMHQVEEWVTGCILQMVGTLSCWDGPSRDCNVMRGIQISQTLFFNEPRNFNFQILAVVDCKKMDPSYSPSSFQALGSSWLWPGLEIHFNQ